MANSTHTNSTRTNSIRPSNTSVISSRSDSFSNASSSRRSISEIRKQGKCPYCEVDPTLFLKTHPFGRHPTEGRLDSVRTEFRNAQPYIQWRLEEKRKHQQELAEAKREKTQKKRTHEQKDSEARPQAQHTEKKKHNLKSRLGQWGLGHRYHLHHSHHQQKNQHQAEGNSTEQPSSATPLKLPTEEVESRPI